jgi:hypothetical protein
VSKSYTIYISREEELEPEPWSATAVDEGESRTVASVSGVSVHDVLIQLAKDIDKVAVPA